MESRPFCYECEEVLIRRPALVCHCPAFPAEPLKLPFNIVIFQHPKEKKAAFSSFRLLRKCIEDITVIVRLRERGVHFEVQELPDPVLLFPTAEASVNPPENFQTLVILDGTWTFARKLFRENEWMQSIPAWKLEPRHVSIFGSLRKPPKEGFLSTADSVALALEELELFEASSQIFQTLENVVRIEEASRKSSNMFFRVKKQEMESLESLIFRRFCKN